VLVPYELLVNSDFQDNWLQGFRVCGVASFCWQWTFRHSFFLFKRWIL